MKQHLIIYAKRPLPGYAKTRLSAEIGVEQAAGVYARLLYTYLADIIRERLHNTAIELATASREDCSYFKQAFPELMVRPQVQGDLGTRMENSFRQAFREGADTVVLTGSDIPGLNANLVRDAFEALHRPAAEHKLPGVIGPTADGGYYLLGLHAPGAKIFRDIAWSTNTVLTSTLERARKQDVELAYLPQLTDLDTSDDYETWTKQLHSSCPSGGTST